MCVRFKHCTSHAGGFGKALMNNASLHFGKMSALENQGGQELGTKKFIFVQSIMLDCHGSGLRRGGSMLEGGLTESKLLPAVAVGAD